MSSTSETPQIRLSAPNIGEREIEAVVEVLRTPNLSLGPKLAEFEGKFRDLCGTKYAVACNSGTSALHLVLAGMGIGPGDELITSPFTFVASSNCAMFVGAKPVFVDIDPKTWCLDPAQVDAAITAQTKVVLPVDVFGVIPDMASIQAIADRHGLRIVEDSCEAAGATYKGRPAGSLGDAGVFGFYPNKQMTTGEGGMLVTDDEQIATIARSVANQGRGGDGGWFGHVRLGYNFRLSDINCALGCVQVDRLPEIIAGRATVARMYNERLADESRISAQETTPGCEKSWFVYVIRLSPEYSGSDRDRIIAGLRKQGIGCTNYFSPLHLQPFYREKFGYKEGDFPVCEELGARTIALPFHASLTEKEIERVVGELQALL